jgi:hypothetical protein
MSMPFHCRTDDARARVRSRTRRGRSFVALVLLALHLGGCFSYVPVSPATMTPGATVSVGINDRGRVALTEQLGPGALRVHGQLLESSDSAATLSVSSIEFLDLSVPAQMAGERVEIPREYAADFRQRELSRSRTVLTIVLAAAALVATSLIAISGFGGDEPGDKPGNGGGGGSQ